MAWTVPRTWVAGELVTAALMNAQVRDNELAIGPHLIARKTSDQSVTSSTVLVDCTTMALPVGANEVWRFGFDVLYAAGTTGDIKFAFTQPTGGRIDATTTGFATGLATQYVQWSDTASPTAVQTFGGSVGLRFFIPIQGIYTNSGTGGNLTLQFAQVASDATPSTVHANSTVWGVKLT